MVLKFLSLSASLPSASAAATEPLLPTPLMVNENSPAFWARPFRVLPASRFMPVP